MKSFVFLLLFSVSAFAGFYDVTETSIDGKPYPMNQLKGKTVLVVNIASQCGYTPQMTDLEALYQKYKDKGFVLVGVPSNDFLSQTPESDKEMMELCQKKYNATYPIMKKGPVSGDKKRELYKVLTEQSPKKFQGGVEWNFAKILVNKNGEVVGRYRSSIKPLDEALTKDIEKNL